MLLLQAMCNEPADGVAAGVPGDGACSLRQAAQLCDEDEMEEMDDFEVRKRLCFVRFCFRSFLTVCEDRWCAKPGSGQT